MCIPIKQSLSVIETIIVYNVGMLVSHHFHSSNNPMNMFLGTITGVTVAGTTGTSGVWSYLLNGPTAIILDATGFMCILDAGNARIMRWWPGASFGTILLATSFSGPVGLQLDRGNNLVVADTGNHRIVSFGLLCRKWIGKEFFSSMFHSFIFSSGNNNNNPTT